MPILLLFLVRTMKMKGSLSLVRTDTTVVHLHDDDVHGRRWRRWHELHDANDDGHDDAEE